jgi:NAD-dependent dihydropyrimidine dehydrogenase PreA subunit
VVHRKNCRRIRGSASVTWSMRRASWRIGERVGPVQRQTQRVAECQGCVCGICAGVCPEKGHVLMNDMMSDASWSTFMVTMSPARRSAR